MCPAFRPSVSCQPRFQQRRCRRRHRDGIVLCSLSLLELSSSFVKGEGGGSQCRNKRVTWELCHVRDVSRSRHEQTVLLLLHAPTRSPTLPYTPRCQKCVRALRWYWLGHFHVPKHNRRNQSSFLLQQAYTPLPIRRGGGKIHFISVSCARWRVACPDGDDTTSEWQSEEREGK